MSRAIELTSAHRATVVALWERCGLVRPWNPPNSDFRRALDGSTSTVLGIVDGDLVATVMVGHDGHRGWVYYLAVDPDWVGAGLGRELMEAAEQWLVERGVPKLNLMVRADNGDALGFYDALGYEPDDVTVLSRFLL